MQIKRRINAAWYAGQDCRTKTEVSGDVSNINLILTILFKRTRLSSLSFLFGIAIGRNEK